MKQIENHNFIKLSKEEVNSIIKNGDLVRTTRLHIINMLQEMEKGEGLILKNEQWPSRTKPDVTLRQLKQLKNIKTSVMTLRDKSGWLIIRK